MHSTSNNVVITILTNMIELLIRKDKEIDCQREIIVSLETELKEAKKNNSKSEVECNLVTSEKVKFYLNKLNMYPHQYENMKFTLEYLFQVNADAQYSNARLIDSINIRTGWGLKKAKEALELFVSMENSRRQTYYSAEDIKYYMDGANVHNKEKIIEMLDYLYHEPPVKTNKIFTIKNVRDKSGWALRECKDFVDLFIQANQQQEE